MEITRIDWGNRIRGMPRIGWGSRFKRLMDGKFIMRGYLTCERDMHPGDMLIIGVRCVPFFIHETDLCMRKCQTSSRDFVLRVTVSKVQNSQPFTEGPSPKRPKSSTLEPSSVHDEMNVKASEHIQNIEKSYNVKTPNTIPTY